jgi:predicted ArsR family transcriptional regulator
MTSSGGDREAWDTSPLEPGAPATGWSEGRNDAMSRTQRARVAWLCERLQLAFISVTRSRLDGDLVSSLLLPAILDANVGHLDADPSVSRRHQALDATYPNELRRPANALSIANFLDIPRETVRARLAEMVAAGVLDTAEGGYILPNSTLTSEWFLPAVPQYLDALNDFVAGLGLIRAFGLQADSRLAHPVWPVAWAAMRLSTAHVLRETAYTRAVTPGMSLTASFILLAVSHDVGGQLRLSSQMPASRGALEALGPALGPVRGTALAARLNLPQETVRRHLNRLIAAGYLCRVKGGYDMAPDTGTLAVWRLFQKRAEANARQLIWRLTKTGVIPTAR